MKLLTLPNKIKIKKEMRIEAPILIKRRPTALATPLATSTSLQQPLKVVSPSPFLSSPFSLSFVSFLLSHSLLCRIRMKPSTSTVGGGLGSLQRPFPPPSLFHSPSLSLLSLLLSPLSTVSNQEMPIISAAAVVAPTALR